MRVGVGGTSMQALQKELAKLLNRINGDQAKKLKLEVVKPIYPYLRVYLHALRRVRVRITLE